MEYKATLDDTLRARFDDRDEMKDINQYGIQGGFSDFIYSTELYEFFERFESEIEDYMHDLGINLNSLVEDKDNWTYQELREKSVWSVVELWIDSKLHTT